MLLPGLMLLVGMPDRVPGRLPAAAERAVASHMNGIVLAGDFDEGDALRVPTRVKLPVIELPGAIPENQITLGRRQLKQLEPFVGGGLPRHGPQEFRRAPLQRGQFGCRLAGNPEETSLLIPILNFTDFAGESHGHR